MIVKVIQEWSPYYDVEESRAKAAKPPHYLAIDDATAARWQEAIRAFYRVQREIEIAITGQSRKPRKR